MANCTICNKPLILAPAAKERAEKFGTRDSAYTRSLTTHGLCSLNERYSDTLAIVRGRSVRVSEQFPERS